MDANGDGGKLKDEAKKQAALRYVRYENLLSTGRAVKRMRGTWVRVHSAGVDAKVWWLEFHTAKDAKLAAGSLERHLREKVARVQIRSNAQWNETISNWIDQLAEQGYLKKREEKAEIEEKESSDGEMAVAETESE